jgi:hypothetical protein
LPALISRHLLKLHSGQLILSLAVCQQEYNPNGSPETGLEPIPGLKSFQQCDPKEKDKHREIFPQSELFHK